MLSEDEKKKIVQRLCEEMEPDLTEEDLRRMLEEELAKDDGHMDVKLVEELLLTLEEGATRREEAEALERITGQLVERGRMPKAMKIATRVMVTLLIILGLTFLTYKTAEAFNWRFLLQLMRPLAETFVLYNGDEPQTQQPEEASLYADELKSGETRKYMSEDEADKVLYGYPVLPGGLPEGMVYLQGSAFSDDLTAIVTHVYLAGSDTCIFRVLIHIDEAQTTSHLYEKTEEDASELYIAGCRLNFYVNSDNATMTASWISEYAEYSLFGKFTEAELRQIVEMTMGQ
ncbi:MAG: hypothetical protein IJE07_11995 [Clostridia bacterium]|nr:hypothetical protein [Clostridia bacterium]